LRCKYTAAEKPIVTLCEPLCAFVSFYADLFLILFFFNEPLIEKRLQIHIAKHPDSY